MPTPVQQKPRKTGTVTEALRAGSFKVTTEEGSEVLAHLSGKMRLYFIRITPGDKVIIELSPYDQTRGRIVQRL